MPTTQVTLPQGVAEGLDEGAVRVFLSLPYAAPLTPERRFRAPAPPENWSGIRDATKPGSAAPQNPPETIEGIDIEPLMGKPTPVEPDYLTLNVFAPSGAGAKRPVMVFIHGGSFVAGSKDAPIYDGRAFARDGVVCVVINYRLGIEGFAPLEGVPTNLGLRDMIAALEWVQSNIHAFDGDAGNVTAFGESGGAFCISALMTSPLCEGLFHHAICQSGHPHVTRDRKVMERVTKRLAQRLRVPPTREGFLSVSIERMLQAQAWVMKPSFFLDLRDDQGRDPSYGITRFLPVHGDDVLPTPAFEAWSQGAGRDIDLLIGATSEEANLFLVPGGGRDKVNAFVAKLFVGRALPRRASAGCLWVEKIWRKARLRAGSCADGSHVSRHDPSRG